jgi:hypothetical protein
MRLHFTEHKADYPLVAGALLSSTMLVVWLLDQPFPPLQDFPEWIYYYCVIKPCLYKEHG